MSRAGGVAVAVAEKAEDVSGGEGEGGGGKDQTGQDEHGGRQGVVVT